MEEIVKKKLETIDFYKRYVSICNKHTDFDKGCNFNKKEVSTILDTLKIKLSYASNEKLFYKTYTFKNFRVRFSFKTKYGFIEFFYQIIFNKDDSNIINRYNGLAKILNKNFDHDSEYPFPIATNLRELEEILTELLQLHLDFIKTFE